MDSLTHALVGALIGELSPKRIKNRQAKGALAAMAPDMANFFAYPYLGIKSGNAIPYAYPQDFYSNPWIVDHWTWIPWEISHSFFFWGFVVMPLLLWFKKTDAAWCGLCLPSALGHALSFWDLEHGTALSLAVPI